MSARLLSLATVLLAAATTVQAIGDFPCAGVNGAQSCAAWAVDADAQGDIAADAICQAGASSFPCPWVLAEEEEQLELTLRRRRRIADPINSTASYCGYAKAACTSNSQCDYGASSCPLAELDGDDADPRRPLLRAGSCGSDGLCAGYLGDACTSNNDCQAFFFCGTDGMCGGSGAACANGDPANPIPSPDQQCVSQSCNTSTQKCAAMPAAGVPNGFGCSSDNICASGASLPSFEPLLRPLPLLLALDG